MSTNLSQPTRPPDLRRTAWMVQVPGLPGRWVPEQPWPPKWGGYWRVSRNCQALSRKLWQIPLPSVAQDTGFYSGRNVPENRLSRQWQITRDLTLKAEVNRLQSWLPTSLMNGGMTSGTTCLKVLIQWKSHCGRWLDGWWESPLHHLPWSHQGDYLSQTSGKPKLLRTDWWLKFRQ